MEKVIRVKFQQNPCLAARLAAVVDCRLIGGDSWHDTFWGVDTAMEKGTIIWKRF